MEPGTYADWFAGSMSAAAVVVALSGYWFSEWQRRKDRRDIERQAGRQIGIKLLRVLNGTDDLHRHLWAKYEGLPLGGEGSTEIWRTVHPLVGLQDDPTLSLTAEESGLLIQANATDFLMEMMLATARYSSMIGSMGEYKIRYEALYELSPPPIEMDGAIGRHTLTREQYLRVQPYSIALESLVQALRQMSAENLVICHRLVDDYNSIMKRHFKGEKVLALGKPEEADRVGSP